MSVQTQKLVGVELSSMHCVEPIKATVAIDSMTVNSLLGNLMEDSSVAFFLRTSGLIYPSASDLSRYWYLQYTWSLLLQTFVVFMLVFGIYFFAFNIKMYQSEDDDWSSNTVSQACIGIALSSQAAIILPSIPKLIARLHSLLCVQVHQ